MKHIVSYFFLVAVMVACSKDPVPPGPGPVPPGPGPIPGPVTFTVKGQKLNAQGLPMIVVEGRMKPGAKVPMATVEAAVKTEVRVLEAKSPNP